MEEFELHHNEKLIQSDICSELLNKYVLVKTKSNDVWAGFLIEKSDDKALLYNATMHSYWYIKHLPSVATDIKQFDLDDHIKSGIHVILNRIWLSEAKIIIELSDEVSNYYESIINKEELKND